MSSNNTPNNRRRTRRHVRYNHHHRHHHHHGDGFSTSLCNDLFANPYNRSSFCVLICCATFLQDRNEYILRRHYQQQQLQQQQQNHIQQQQQQQQQQRGPPLDWWRRLLLYVGVSAILYVSVNHCYDVVGTNHGTTTHRNSAQGEEEEEDDYSYTYAGAAAVALYVALLSVRATWKRAKFRRSVLRLVQQQHSQQHPVESSQQHEEEQVQDDVAYYVYDDDEEDENENNGGWCSQNQRVHYTCSLVRADNHNDDDDDCGCCRCRSCCCCNSQNSHSVAADTSSSSRPTATPYRPPPPPPTPPPPPPPRDVCSNLWTCLAASCCGCWLKCWWNCCGVCATAQEARELQRHLPRRSLYIDYITFEPWSNYYPQIQALRRRRRQPAAAVHYSFWQHLTATSQLSQMLLQILLVTLILLLLASALHLVHDFSYQKVLVICATLAQAILILYFCYWQDHRLDVSLDAIVKLFAAGFCFATVFSMIVEQVLTAVGINVLGLTLGILNANHATISHDKEDNDANSSKSHHSNSHNSAHNANDPVVDNDSFVDPNDYQDEPPEKFFFALIQQYPWTYIAYLFFSAFVVAGMVEETAKYFCFWMVEHPDFVYDDNQESETEQRPPLQHTSPNGVATAVSTESNETQPLVASSTATTTTTTARQQYGTSTPTSLLPLPSPPTTELVFEPGTFRSRAAAITAAMIATASGFACLENLIYVFGTGFGTSLKGEITILLFRSALPVHPLCAAIQSIGIVKRDIEHRYRNSQQQQHGQENGHASSLSSSSSSSSYYGLGKAMLPAIILHGTFDFVLFVLGFLSALYAGNNGADGDGVGDENENEAMLKYSMGTWSSSPWTTGAPFNGSFGTTTFWSYRVTGSSSSNNNDDDDNLESTPASSLVAWMNILSLFAGPVIFLMGVVYYCVESFRQRGRLDDMDDAAAATLLQQEQQQGFRNGPSVQPD